MHRLYRAIRSLHRDRRGSVALVGSIAITACVLVVGIVIDSSIANTHQRVLQSAVDLAAIDGARDVSRAETLVRESLARNGFPAPHTLSVLTGRYEADTTRPTGQRFVVGSLPANAVRVEATSLPPVALWHSFFDGQGPVVTAAAVAADTGIAAFAIGTRLASLNEGVLNQILGNLLGAELSLSVMDYNALLDARLDMIDLLDRLAVEAEIAGGTYTDIAELDVGWWDFADTVEGMLRDDGALMSVLSAVAKIDAAAGTTIPLGQLIDIGHLGTIPVGGDTGGLDAQASVFDLIFAAARLVDGARAISLDLDVETGLVDATIALAIGEPMQGSRWMTIGEEGVTLHTAQTRLYLEATVLGTSGQLLDHLVTVPIYLTVASGDAQLADITCGGSRDTSWVTVSARPAVAEAWIGAIDRSRLADFGFTNTPSEAALVSIGIGTGLLSSVVTVRASGHAAMANPTPISLVFSHADIAAARVKTADTRSYLASTLGTLFSSASLTSTVVGIALPAPSLLAGTRALLSTIATPLDGIIGSILRAAGVSVGQMDVLVGGIRCDGAALVL
ncbi:MAG: hypothetical protein KIT43_04620 [Bauldia sp.]|nr:hypothetical protein [Bauldia sp.]